MPALIGVKHRFAIQKAATWGTVVDAATDDLFPVNEDGATIESQTERIANMELNDSPMAGIGDAGNEAVSGVINRNLHYRGDHVVCAGVMGTAGVPSQIGTTTYYTHRLTPATSLEGLFYSLFADMEISTYEVASAKLTGMTIKGVSGKYVTIEFRYIGNDLDVAGNVPWGSVTEHADAARNFVVYSHGLFMVNAQAGGAVADPTDTIYPTEFEIAFDNNFEEFTTSQNDPNIDEPLRNGFLTCSGSFKVPQYAANTHVTQILAQTALKGELRFASSSEAFRFFIPQFFWTGDIPQVSGPGRVPLDLAWQAEKAASNPTGMDSTMPYLEFDNTDSADPLA